MKIVIAGSRLGCMPEVLNAGIEASGFDITEVVCGCANGVDSMGYAFGITTGTPVKHFPAQWDLYHKAAGHFRNAQMALYGEGLIAFLEPDSKGTANMIRQAQNVKIPLYIHPLEKEREFWVLTHKEVEDNVEILRG